MRNLPGILAVVGLFWVGSGNALAGTPHCNDPAWQTMEAQCCPVCKGDAGEGINVAQTCANNCAAECNLQCTCPACTVTSNVVQCKSVKLLRSGARIMKGCKILTEAN